MAPYPLVDDLLGPILRVAMHRKVRQRQYRTLLLPSAGPGIDIQVPYRRTQRDVKSAVVLIGYLSTRETKNHPLASTESGP